MVIGILAHVYAGKTTLSEAILYITGKIKKIGRVDNKNSFFDSHKIERERGITVFSKQSPFPLGDSNAVLLDTPGHTDFSAETERTLSVLDYAILVISGTEGVQSHTETLWHLLELYSVPTFVFITKMDITTLSESKIMASLEKKFGTGCINFTSVIFH